MSRTFAGIPSEFATFENSKTVLLPVAYDGTSTWGKGADKGPEAFLHAAENMELYDIESASEPFRNGIHLLPLVGGFASPEKMIEKIYVEATKYMAIGKLFSMVGGEHSVSIGALRAANDLYENLTVLQLDAHSDLRPEYDGSTCNHACAMHEASKKSKLIQVGIRSMDIVEVPFLKKENVFFANDIRKKKDWIDQVCSKLTDNTYITIDLDVFDPSVLPSTGTPEPGGMIYYEVLDLLEKVISKTKIIGFDIVELCPNAIDKSSDFLAAKLYYKILSYIFKKHTHDK